MPSRRSSRLITRREFHEGLQQQEAKRASLEAAIQMLNAMYLKQGVKIQDQAIEIQQLKLVIVQLSNELVRAKQVVGNAFAVSAICRVLLGLENICDPFVIAPPPPKTFAARFQEVSVDFLGTIFGSSKIHYFMSRKVGLLVLLCSKSVRANLFSGPDKTRLEGVGVHVGRTRRYSQRNNKLMSFS